jgi:hypothetical protein
VAQTPAAALDRHRTRRRPPRSVHGPSGGEDQGRRRALPSGDVKELVSEAPLGDVDSIEVKRLAVDKTVSVSVRGTPFVLEVGAGANAKGVAEEFERAKAPA